MEFLVFLVLFLAITGHSSATYCICKDGVGESALQKAIDYACGNGADCTAIQQNGACYNPNTVKDHCSYAVNSYFQRKSQAPMSCDFSGSAITSPSVPTQSNGCVYQAAPGSTNTPPSGTPPSGTPPSGTPPSGTPPTTNTPPSSTTPPSTNTPPSSGTPGTTPGSSNTPPTYGGLGPSTGTYDDAHHHVIHQITNLIFPIAFTTITILGWFSGFLQR